MSYKTSIFRSIYFISTPIVLTAFSPHLALAAPAALGDLVISEIHYNPYDPTPEEVSAGKSLASDFEFIEIHNVSGISVELNGVVISGGIDFTFGALALPANGYTVVAKSPSAFALRYPTASTPGNYAKSLSNTGESLVVTSAGNVALLNFTYGSIGQWPGRADGKGSSLELLDPNNASADFNSPDTWRASSEYNGSPGSAGAGADNRIVINEVSSHTDFPDVDAIELHNTTNSPIEIGGWMLSDNSAVYPSLIIPPTTLAAGGYVTFDESHFNPTPTIAINDYSDATGKTKVNSNGHGLSTGDTVTISGYGGEGLYNGSWKITVTSNDAFTIETPYLDNVATKGLWIQGRPFRLSGSKGEDLWLLSVDPNGNPTRFVDHVDFAAAFNWETLGRWPNAEGTGTLISMTSNTLGNENLGAQVGPVIISEVMFHPNPPSGEAEDNFEYVEVYNAGSVTENLANWRLRGGADFDFTSSQTLAPEGSLIVVAFDPLASPSAASTFRNHYGIDNSILLVGPFIDGPLGNENGTVRLQRPDTPPATDPLLYPQVTEDEARYRNVSPWPTGSNGTGNSINRVSKQWFGNFGSSWESDTSSPGGIRLYYAGWKENYFGSANPPGSSEADDFDQDGTPNIVEFALALNPTTPDADLVPALEWDGTSATMTYLADSLRSGLSYRVEYSTDLSDWITAPESILSTSLFTQTIQASAPATANGKMFMRMSIDTP